MTSLIYCVLSSPLLFYSNLFNYLLCSALFLFSSLLSFSILFSPLLFSSLLFFYSNLFSSLLSSPLLFYVLFYVLFSSPPLFCSVLLSPGTCLVGDAMQRTMTCSNSGTHCTVLHGAVTYCSILYNAVTYCSVA